jgi:hypothetical protein
MSLAELTKYYTVVHQTGDTANAANSLSKNSNERYKPFGYFKNEIPHIIAAAELVLCRSGAGISASDRKQSESQVIVVGSHGGCLRRGRLGRRAAQCTDAGLQA